MTIGPFGSPFVDSLRTAVSEQTVDALQVFFLKPSMSIEDAEQLVAAAGKMFTQVNGGNFSSVILNKDQVQANLPYYIMIA